MPYGHARRKRVKVRKQTILIEDLYERDFKWRSTTSLVCVAPIFYLEQKFSLKLSVGHYDNPIITGQWQYCWTECKCLDFDVSRDNSDKVAME